MESDRSLAGTSCTAAPEIGRVRRHQRRDIDWRAIEEDYRAGPLSLRELALKHGCSHSAIANFAGRHGWPRRRAEAPDRPTGSHRQTTGANE